MLKRFLDTFHNLDKEIKNLIKKGSLFSFASCLLSTLILITYHFYLSPSLYMVGTLLFKFSLIIFSSFIIMGIGFDKIKKQIA